MRKLLYVAIVLGLVIGVYLGYLKWGGKKSFAAREIIQPLVKENSRWKYLVKRTITKQELGRPGKQINVDRAFVYFGQGADKAGGQVKTVPNVVYINDSNEPFTKYVCHGPPFTLLTSEVLKLTQMSDLEQPQMGSEPNEPMPLFILVNSFFLPLMPVEELENGVGWSRTLYVTKAGLRGSFPVKIKHMIEGYEIRKSMKCAAVKYTIKGQWTMADHPEVFKKKELFSAKGTLQVEGEGTFWLETGVIVEKEQKLSWTFCQEKLKGNDDGSTNWVPVVDEEHSFEAVISLQREAHKN